MDSSAPRWNRRTELWAYFALAYGLTWAVHIPLALAAKGLLPLSLPPGVHFLGAAGPISAALIVTAASRGTSGLRELVGRMFRWRIGQRWLLAARGEPPLAGAAVRSCNPHPRTAPLSIHRPSSSARHR